MKNWEPISEEAMIKRVSQGELRMNPAQRNIWQAIRIKAEKWKQSPYGDPGNGFWVVAIVGRSVIWYNDIEDGFNRSSYSTYGKIDHYWRNQDELEVTISFLLSSIEKGTDLVQIGDKPAIVKRKWGLTR